jgi:GDP/UDP-N,N'-diacetylbacillosamine 2-epimerase (hydrolysing)
MKICIITTTRADFGLLKNLILELKKNKFKIKIIAGGTHYLKRFGNTFREIEKFKIKVDKKIYFNSNHDNFREIARILSIHINESVKIFECLKPDLLIVLGDRYEVLGTAIAAHITRIPIAHIHGGELTIGLIDDAFRHSITKMSQLHFVANKIYRNRVIQLGENPKNVFVVGGLGVDSISKVKLLSKNTLMDKLKIIFNKKNLIVSFHPETLKKNLTKIQIKELLNALKTLKNTCIIFTSPGSDLDNQIIVNEIKNFVNHKDNAYYFPSLGQKNYYSILKIVDAIIGNSSSGILEMPTFKNATINIGDRQLGRIKSNNIIDCKIRKKDILKALKKVYSNKFKRKTKSFKSSYGSAGASIKIVKILKKISLKNILIKKFYDINNVRT